MRSQVESASQDKQSLETRVGEHEVQLAEFKTLGEELERTKLTLEASAQRETEFNETLLGKEQSAKTEVIKLQESLAQAQNELSAATQRESQLRADSRSFELLSRDRSMELQRELEASEKRNKVLSANLDSLAEQLERQRQHAATLTKQQEQLSENLKKWDSTTQPRTKSNGLSGIKGIGPKFREKLEAHGITRVEQIANWSSDDIADFSERMGLRDRIMKQQWVEQAKAIVEAQPKADDA